MVCLLIFWGTYSIFCNQNFENTKQCRTCMQWWKCMMKCMCYVDATAYMEWAALGKGWGLISSGSSRGCETSMLSEVGRDNCEACGQTIYTVRSCCYNVTKLCSLEQVLRTTWKLRGPCLTCRKVARLLCLLKDALHHTVAGNVNVGQGWLCLINHAHLHSIIDHEQCFMLIVMLQQCRLCCARVSPHASACLSRWRSWYKSFKKQWLKWYPEQP